MYLHSIVSSTNAAHLGKNKLMLKLIYLYFLEQAGSNT